MHMDIFDDDAFSAVSMTSALEDYEFKPGLIGSLNLFEDVPTSTTAISVERRAGNVLSIIQTSLRGAPLEEGASDKGRNLRSFETTRIAKGKTLNASEIQNVRAFGSETELETMVSYVARYENRLIGDAELTWENMMFGAVQGKVLDADSSILVDWFSEWGIPEPAEISFDLDDPAIDVEQKCREIVRASMRASQGAWRANTFVLGLAGDSFFDKLTKHKSIRETYLNTAQATLLNRKFGVADTAVFREGAFAAFECGGIVFVNYRGVDSFNAGAAPGSKDALGIAPIKCRFFPVGAPGVFQQAFAPAESFDYANTIGRKLYAMLIRDEKRNFWVRPEVYSYPLFICTRPEMLLRAKEA